jgi:ribosomal protein S6
MALYEGMFLINNDLVRAGWPQAKALVTDLVAKHGGTVRTARRWDERPLAYPIRGKRRATYLLTFFEMDGAAIPAFRRELEIKENLLRYLQLSADAIPDGEAELSAAEDGAEFSVPEPPEDVAPPIAPEFLDRPREERERRPRREEPSDDDSDEDSDDEDSDDGEPVEKPMRRRAPAMAKSESKPESKAEQES